MAFEAIRSLFARKPQIIPPAADRPRFYAHIPAHPSKGLTLSKLSGYVERAERGDMEAQSELVSDLFDKEPTLLGLFQTRAYAVLSKPWAVEPIKGETKSKAERQAAWITDVLQNLSLSYQTTGLAAEYLTWEEAKEYLLTAVPYGFAAAFCEWDRKTWTLKALRACEQKHFTFGDITLSGSPSYNPYELRFRTEERPAEGIPIEPNQAVMHFYKAKPVLPARFSLARTLFYWYVFKMRAMSSMVRYGERFGQPLILGYYDPNDQTGGSDHDVVVQAVRDLGSDAGAVLSRASGDTASRIEFVEPQGSTSSIHDRLIALVNDEYAKCILGHSSAAEATPGKLGEQTDSLEAQNYRIERDAIALDATINEQIIRVMAEGVDGRMMCRYKTQYERREDLNEKAKRMQVLTLIPGFRVPASYLYDEFDVPEPREGDETVGTPPTDDPATSLMRSAAQQAAQGAARGASMNAVRFGKATGPEARRAKARALQSALAAEANKLQNKCAPIYAALLDGVRPKGDILEQIRENLDDFRKDFGPVMKNALVAAGNLALKSFGMGDVAAFRMDPPAFSLKDDAAVEFLDWQAFSLTVIEGESISVDLADRIATATAAGASEGITMREFYARILDEAGVGATNRHHMETVFRTNLATASNASKLFGMAKDPEGFPGWQFLAVMDDYTTDYCQPLNNRYFANGDRKNFPPLHFNCRSEGVPVTAAEWEAEGLKAEKAAPSGQEGFENTAVRDYDDWVAGEADKSSAINDLITNYKGKTK